MRRLASRAPLFTDAPTQNHSAFIQLSFLIEKVWTMLDFQKEEVCLVAGVGGWGGGCAELKVAKQNQVHGKKAESSTKYRLMSTPHFNRF